MKTCKPSSRFSSQTASSLLAAPPKPTVGCPLKRFLSPHLRSHRVPVFFLQNASQRHPSLAPRSNPDHGSILSPRHRPLPSPVHQPLHRPQSFLLLLAAELCENLTCQCRVPVTLHPAFFSSARSSTGLSPPCSPFPTPPHLTPSLTSPGWAFSEDSLPRLPSFRRFAWCPVPPLKLHVAAHYSCQVMSPV